MLIHGSDSDTYISLTRTPDRMTEVGTLREGLGAYIALKDGVEKRKVVCELSMVKDQCMSNHPNSSSLSHGAGGHMSMKTCLEEA